VSLVEKRAPVFELEGVANGEFVTVDLEELHGQWVIVFFYPLDFSFVCPTEIRGFNERSEQFAELGAQILAISVDSKYAHLAWQNGDLGEVAYPLLSDITKQVSRRYGVLLEEQGISLRGLFIIDPEGIVRYEVVHDEDAGRSVAETLRVLQALQTGHLCPVDWQPGDEDLGEA